MCVCVCRNGRSTKTANKWHHRANVPLTTTNQFSHTSRMYLYVYIFSCVYRTRTHVVLLHVGICTVFCVIPTAFSTAFHTPSEIWSIRKYKNIYARASRTIVSCSKRAHTRVVLRVRYSVIDKNALTRDFWKPDTCIACARTSNLRRSYCAYGVLFFLQSFVSTRLAIAKIASSDKKHWNVALCPLLPQWHTLNLTLWGESFLKNSNKIFPFYS